MKTVKRSRLMTWLHRIFWKLHRSWFGIKIVRRPEWISDEEARRLVRMAGCQRNGLLCLDVKVTRVEKRGRVEELWMPAKKGESWDKDIYPEIKEKP